MIEVLKFLLNIQIKVNASSYDSINQSYGLTTVDNFATNVYNTYVSPNSDIIENTIALSHPQVLSYVVSTVLAKCMALSVPSVALSEGVLKIRPTSFTPLFIRGNSFFIISFIYSSIFF